MREKQTRTRAAIPILPTDGDTARSRSGVSTDTSSAPAAPSPPASAVDSAAEMRKRRTLIADLALFRDMAAETVEEMPLGFVALDHAMCATYANPMALTLTGASLDALVGRRPWDIFPEIVGTQHQTVRASTPVTIEYEGHFAPSERWAAVLACPTQTGISIFLRDISGQKRAEETVRSSVALLHGSLDTMLDACMVCSAERDAQGAIVSFRVDFANVVAGTYLGSPPEKLIGAPIPEWKINPRDMPFVDACRRVVETGDPWAIDALAYAIAGPEGTSTPGALSLQVARFSDGFFATWRDVTETQRLARERERLAVIVDQVADGIVAVDAELRVTYANAAFADDLGGRASEMIGRSVLEVVDGVLDGPTVAKLTEVARSGQPWLGEAERRLANGTVGPVQIRVTPRRAANGALEGYVVVSRDVTELRQSEAERARLWTAIEQSADAVVITDADARIEYVNPAFERVTGYTREEVLGQNPRILKSGVHGPAFYAAMWATLKSGHSFVGNLTNRRKDGSLFQDETVISPIVNADGAITSYVEVKRDVTRERALEAAWERQARERALVAGALGAITAGPSLAATAEAICRQIVSLARLTTAALYYFALDGKAMPLAFVRADGEPVPLRSLPFQRSRRLHEQSEAGPWAEAWVHRPWHPSDRLFRELGVTASAYAPVRDHGTLVGLLIITSAEVDATSPLSDFLPALIEFATVSGALVGPAMIDLTEVGSIRHRIVKTIGEGLFHPVFQPIVDLQSRGIVGYEALTRFDSGQRPDLCFADAWAVDMGPALELATLQAAVAAAHLLPAARWLSLNVSPRLLADTDRLKAVLWPSDRPIVLEITEHEIIEDYAAVQSALRVIGPDVRLAVDDAGSGIANFTHIIELRPNLVKLDIGLVRGVNADLGRQALVVGMRHFAAEAGCRLLAEGVETEAEAETLLALGVDLGQGYEFGHPEPAETWVARAAALEAARARGDAAVARTEAAVVRSQAAAELEPLPRPRTRATGRRERIPRAGMAAAGRDVVADARDEIAAGRDVVADARDATERR